MSDYRRIEGDRTASQAAGRRRGPSRKQIIVAVGIFAVLMVVLFAWRPSPKSREDLSAKPATLAGAMLPYVPPPREPPPEPPKIVPVVAQVPMAPRPPPALPEPRSLVQAVHQEKKGEEGPTWMTSYKVPPLPDGLKKEHAAGDTGGAGAAADAGGVVYKPAAVTGAQAAPMGDTSLVLMPGPVACVLDTAINSDLPGPFQCHLEQPVMSPSRVAVMDRGTIIEGTYDSHVLQGQKRLLTMTGYAITPSHCQVPLGGPMADALGRTGLAGEVDNHLWERFGGAVLLSLVDSGFSTLQSAMSKGNNTYLSFQGNGVSSLAQEVLRNTINIPPTIEVHAGETVRAWITTPISFDRCYRLRPAP